MNTTTAILVVDLGLTFEYVYIVVTAIFFPRNLGTILIASSLFVVLKIELIYFGRLRKPPNF